MLCDTGPYTEVCTAILKLVNCGDERLAYKVQTKAPQKYAVKPRKGFIESCTTMNVKGIAMCYSVFCYMWCTFDLHS